MPGSEEFARLTEPFRAELLAHCYRMLGSVYDAEDQVQETLMRAWRSYGEFEGRASLRTWLYRIATNVCLRALENRGRRPLPSGLGAPERGPGRAAGRRPAGGPLAAALPRRAAGRRDPRIPAAIAASRASVRLALIAAMQYLPARQRAVLILRDVLGWRAAEVAGLLGTSTVAVNSALQRARAHLAQAAPAEEEISEPDDPAIQALLSRYAAAFENADVAGLIRLLRDDAVFEMPPLPTWYAGREPIGRFMAVVGPAPAGNLPHDPGRGQRPARVRCLHARRRRRLPCSRRPGAHRHPVRLVTGRLVQRRRPVRHLRPARVHSA